jgi:23S rRNA pseudouridine2605 synthase
MITNKDDSRYYDSNNDTNREGHTSSPRKTINVGPREQNSRPVYSSSNDGIVKKKRPRVGDAPRTSPNREQSYNRGGNYDRPQGQRDYDNRRPNSSNYSENRPSYPNQRNYEQRGEGRPSGGRTYGNSNSYGGGGGSYNNNRGGGYNRNDDRRPNAGGSGRPPQGGGQYGGGPKRKPMLSKPVKYKEDIDPNTPIRLNKYLANAGVCSRREADNLIEAGVVKVNGEVVNELGAKVLRGDLVTFHDEPVKLESKVYVLLNKPKNTLTTSDDPKNRKTVMDLVKNACPERIFPVGRLDRNTTGVLLLTNDGDLASKLMHPKYKKKKIYQVTLDRDVAMEDMQMIADGIELEDGEIHADSIAYVAEDVFNEVGIEIHSGRNRLVRRIFEKLGYHVIKLDRVLFAGLTKKNLPRGKWRYLNEQEVNMLRMGAFE